MRYLLTGSLICSLWISSVQAADTHPFAVQDLVAMSRLSDARVSPDGTRVVFTVSVPDLEQNKIHSEIYLAALDGSWVKRITSAEASSNQARWAGSKAIVFLSARTGSDQVWKLALDGGEAQQLTRLPLDVGALEVAPDGNRLLLSMAVLPGKSPEETERILGEKEKTKATGMLFDHLFVRHWDAWNDGTRNHVFTYDPISGTARDLMPGMDADCPTKPYGGVEDFAVSPDQTLVVFSAKDMGAEKSAEAWSTNFDLFQVPFDGSSAPRRITTNPAWDAQPKFSPDGRTLAYLAMSRPMRHRPGIALPVPSPGPRTARRSTAWRSTWARMPCSQWTWPPTRPRSWWAKVPLSAFSLWRGHGSSMA
jgi:dipeptidyl aminopeptidase/acylaminoacyl peptidase